MYADVQQIFPYTVFTYDSRVLHKLIAFVKTIIDHAYSLYNMGKFSYHIKANPLNMTTMPIYIPYTYYYERISEKVTRIVILSH